MTALVTPPARGKSSSNKIDEVKQIVFLVDKGKAKSVDIKTGISDDNYIEVTSGLKEGETVVSGSYKAISRELKDGVTVRVEDQNKKFVPNNSGS